MSIALKILLSPIALIYGFVIKLRNLLFDYSILRSISVNKATICVGNLTVGGTGKTPHIEHLIRFLSQQKSIATLSRGYKRKTKGFLYVDTDSLAEQVGDEPLQLKTKFPKVTVAVDGNRVRGARRLIADHPEIEVILLDDAFQHRYLKSGFSILLVDYNNLITKDLFLPLGRLRDSLKEKHRADCVIVTKCPDGIKPIDQQKITKELNLLPYQPVFFSWFEYGEPVPIFQDSNSTLTISKSTKTLAFAGIANPNPFFQYVENHARLIDQLVFPDHFTYSEKKINAIFEKFCSYEGDNKAIITTEKDAVRVRGINNLNNSIKRSFYYIPIKVVFSGESVNDFNLKIETYVSKSKRDHNLHSE